MKNPSTFKLTILFFTFFLISSLNGQVNLSGNWELRRISPAPDGVVNMSMTQQGNTIFASGDGWRGEGKITGTKGYYNWTFNDGRTGKTSFTYNAEFDILVSGKVYGSGIDWAFTGNRYSTAPSNFSGTWYSSTFAYFLIVDQRGANVEGFFEAVDGAFYGQGKGKRIFSTFSGSKGHGVLDIYRSVDGTKIYINRWYTSPSKAFGKATYQLTPGQITASPPTGWITSDLKQGCTQCYTGYRLGIPSLCTDPRTQVIIDAWLSRTRPFDNWDQAQYDCWGRWYGRGPTGSVSTNNCLPPETDGRSRCEFVLYFLSSKYSKELKSTLLMYVKKHLKN